MPPTIQSDRPKTSRRLLRAVASVALAGVAVAAIVNSQTIIDEYALATYKMPADIAALAAPLQLTRQGQALLGRAQPQIDNKASFNKDCETQKGDLELGCYNGGRIYILRIDNTSLAPEMETVLAHELMHAAWSRMSPEEQRSLGGELEDVYAGLHDQDLSSRMAGYAKSEPGQETNELHSILGTEQAQLPSALAQHYLRYFVDRANIVAAHDAYEEVFAVQGKQLEDQLATIKSLKSQLATMNARMSAYRASGQIAAYNALVPPQNSLVDRINSLITTYDEAVDEYNSLSASIDSHHLDTEPGV